MASLRQVRPGRQLYVRTKTTATTATDNPPGYNLIFLHGTCGSSAQFDTVLEELRKNSITNEKLPCACYLYDAVGCGQSPVVHDWTAYETDEAVSDVASILENANVVDKSLPTILIGHSYASTVMIRFLKQWNDNNCDDDDNHINHNERPNIVGCIFISPALRTNLNPNNDGGHVVFGLPVLVLECLQSVLTGLFLEAAYHPSTDPVILQHAREASNNNSMYVAKAYHTHHVWATPNECKDALFRKEGQKMDLSGIGNDGRSTVPKVLVLHGKQDKVLPVEAGQQFADVCNATTTVVVEEASHNVMEEQPRAVSDAIAEFLLSLSSSLSQRQ